MHLKKRNIIAVIILSYITLGIYSVYWLYKTRLELVAQTGNERDIPRIRTMFMPLVFLVLIVGANLLVDSSASSSRSGAQAGASVILIVASLVFVVLTIVRSIQFLRAYCRTVTRVTEQRTDNTLFWTWILCDLFSLPIGQILAQNSINQFVNRSSGQGGMPTNGPAPGTTPNYPTQPFSPVQ